MPSLLSGLVTLDIVLSPHLLVPGPKKLKYPSWQLYLLVQQDHFYNPLNTRMSNHTDYRDAKTEIQSH